MPQLLVKCDDCGAINDYSALRAAYWKCPECQAILMPAPTQKQINYAVSLGIESPEKLSAEELGPLINDRKRQMDEEARVRKAGLLAEADPDALLREFHRRGFEFVMLVSHGGRASPGQMQLASTDAYGDALNVLTQYVLLAIKGELDLLPKNHVAVRA